jgi:hypothetical protein
MLNDDCKIIISPDLPNTTFTRNKLKENFDNIKSKVKLFRERITIDHNINCSKYDTIYVMSDIHADYLKFVQTLVNNNLLEFDGVTDVYKEKYDARIINTARWRGGIKSCF